MSEVIVAKARPRSLLLYLGGLVVVGVSVLGVVLLAHTRASQAREETSERRQLQNAGPRVLVAYAKRSLPERTIKVQAEAHPYAEVTLYAKVAGYLRDIRVDKGDEVKVGEFLARIEAPEIDAQYVASKADAKYKKVIAQRAETLVKPGVVSVQDRDVAVSNAEVSAANQRASETERGYETLRAPFDGTVTARFADPGALLQSAANAQSSALPIVTVAQIDTLRVYAYVDQRDAPFLKVGDPAEVRLAERPEVVFRAKITRLADELDSRTRMMLVEVDLDNHARQIVAGSFVYVTFHLTVPSYVEVPAAALVMQGKRPMVATIGEDNRLKLQSVEVVNDDGELAWLSKGIVEGQRLGLNVGDGVTDGEVVQPVAPKGTGGADLAKPK